MHSKDGKHQIGYSLHRLTFILQRMCEESLQTELGIGFSQFKMMHIIAKCPVAEQRDLARNLGQTEASVSRQARLMKNMGLIHIERDKKDARIRRLSLTAKGKLKYQKAQKNLHKVHAQTTSQFNEKQINQIDNFLGDMLNSLGYSDKF